MTEQSALVCSVATKKYSNDQKHDEVRFHFRRHMAGFLCFAYKLYDRLAYLVIEFLAVFIEIPGMIMQFQKEKVIGMPSGKVFHLDPDMLELITYGYLFVKSLKQMLSEL